jgi:hypothetical protein
MPYFSQELDVYVDEFIDECSIGELNKNFKRKRRVEILNLNIYI